MRDDDKTEPPDPNDIADLLRERYPLLAKDRLSVTVPDAPPFALELELSSGRDRYTIAVSYRRGGEGRDPWMAAADALDALFATFLENGRAYRQLPAGEDVEYEGAFFDVRVEHAIPELESRADRLLDEENGPTPRKP